MAAAGFTPADYETDPVEVLPENWRAVNLFCRLGTQWRVGMNGATGLDYSAVYPLLDREATSPPDWDDLFDDIQTCEQAALSAMNAKT